MEDKTTETLYPLQCYMVYKQCPKCDVGNMTPTGKAFLTYPAKYPHKCDSCGYEQCYTKTYPCVEFRDSQLHPVSDKLVEDAIQEDMIQTAKTMLKRRNHEVCRM